MTKKIVSAKDILAEKGYVLPKFDTAGFTEAVVRFFRSHGVEASLIVRPVRFVEEQERYPRCGWVAICEWDEELQELLKRWHAAGYDNSRYTDIEEYMEWYYEYYVVRTPSILVDEPFCKNAVNMLAIMQGFVVKSRMRKKKREYVITLL